MSNDPRFDRRAFLRASGAVAVGAAVAGCTDTGGDTQEPADGGNDTDDNETMGNETDANQTTGNETDANQTAGNESDSNQTGNASAGGGDMVEVIAGPGGDLVFEPAELSIDAGTTVRWVWDSDNHNVVPTSQPQGANWEGYPEIANAGTEYEHTFETTGTYEYVCEPHEAAGMVGSITVE
ncbi:MAG TPA: plastocyanin/azurin family copper-binding protein [Natronoarchaeum rubrum]|nr:plastocyanin/azurin family copper-binding protein [Natronoarchaeum rubrum]